MKMVICPTCKTETQGQLKTKKETYPVKGKPIEIQAEVVFCSKCGNEIFDEEYDAKNMDAAYAAYRKNNGLLTPSEITAIRNKYGMGQRAFARLLNWGEVTLHRYEAGAVQDAAHDRVLRFIDKPQNMRQIFEQNYDVLSPATREAFTERLDHLVEEEVAFTFRDILERIIGHKEIDILSGFKAFDLDKFENMIIYFADALNGVLKTKINKLLWYADFLSFKEHTVSMSGSKYRHVEFGPVPEEYQLIIGNMIHENQIVIKEQIFDEEKNVVGEEIYSLVEPNISIFNNRERLIMDFLIEYFRNFGSGKIAKYSHEEKAFKDTADGEYISYNYAQDLTLSLPAK